MQAHTQISAKHIIVITVAKHMFAQEMHKIVDTSTECQSTVTKDTKLTTHLLCQP